MRYVDAFRDPALAQGIIRRLQSRTSAPMRFMEFCGGHTHAIMRHGIRQLLPPNIELLSGPGCPVCVTATGDLDYAIALAALPEVIMASFGDMIRVPSSRSSLQQAKAQGADVRIVYSTLDALAIARQNPNRQVVFMGIGFETTTPTVAASILQAEREGLTNYYVLSAHKLTPAATRAILDAGEVRLTGILGPGHVTTIGGLDMWTFLPQDYGLPCAVAGFEPLDLLRAIDMLAEMVESGQPAVRNAYGRSVQAAGNPAARRIMAQVFEPCSARWRGLATVPQSGLRLRERYARFDAARAFPLDLPPAQEPQGCRCGEVLRGVMLPPDCPLYGRACTPVHPIGPCMVSSEGACAAFYQYGEHDA